MTINIEQNYETVLANTEHDQQPRNQACQHRTPPHTCKLTWTIFMLELCHAAGGWRWGKGIILTYTAIGTFTGKKCVVSMDKCRMRSLQ